MEKVIFDMPSDPEMFLAALSAVQAWRLEQDLQVTHILAQIDKIAAQNEDCFRAKSYPFGKYALICDNIGRHRKDTEARRYDISIHLSDSSFDIFRPAFGSGITFLDEYNPERDEWDLAFQFTLDRAWAVAASTEKHAAIAMGLLVGAEAKSLPDLSACVDYKEEKRIDVVLIPWGDTASYNAIVQYMFNNKPDMNFECQLRGTPSLWRIIHSDMVVGMRSEHTYIASALGKKVVELYPDDKYKRWLSKWDNPNYSMIYGKEFPASMIWRSMETLWEKPSIELDKTPRDLFSARGTMGGLSAGAVNREI